MSHEEPLARVGDLPREIEPARDLWPDIEAGILQEGRRDGSDRVIEGRFDRWRRPALAAAAIAIVFLAGYGVAQLDSFRGDVAGPAAGIADSGAPSVFTAKSTSGEEESIDAILAAQTDSILAVLARRENELDPATVKVLRENLTVIDGAAGDIRAALERDPGNPRLKRMQYTEQRRRGDVLSRAVDLLNII